MKKVILSSGDDVEITSPEGALYNPITKSHTRQYFRDKDTVACIYDVLLDVEYWCLANELEGTNGVISNVDVATDKLAVINYLGGFIGK